MTAAAAIAAPDAIGATAVPGATGADGSSFSHLTFDAARGSCVTGGSARGSEARDRLRNKLIDVGQRFVGFDKVIECDTVRRKQQEASKVSCAQEGLLKLEKAMNAEIRRRVDANKQVQGLTEQMANDMLERLQGSILARVETLAACIQSLTLRSTALEKGIAQFRGELPTKLQVDTAALVKEINDMRTQMDMNRKQRIERDTVLLRRLAEMETAEAAQFESASDQLVQTCEQLHAEVDRLHRSNEIGDNRTEKFRTFILEEIAGMKNTLGVSGQTREQTDDEIVQAMNQYTNALQKGLHSANNRGW